MYTLKGDINIGIAAIATRNDIDALGAEKRCEMAIGASGAVFTSVNGIRLCNLSGPIRIIVSQNDAILVCTDGEAHAVDIKLRRSLFGFGRKVIVTGNPRSPYAYGQIVHVYLRLDQEIKLRNCSGSVVTDGSRSPFWSL